MQTQAQILGVSTVVGNVSLAAATRNTRAVLALAGWADIPVWAGAATALWAIGVWILCQPMAMRGIMSHS